MKPLGVYVHWPFCKSKCPYCDFNSHVREGVDHRRWRAALLRELDHAAGEAPGRKVETIFFGGGTPSLMEPETVAAVIARVRELWACADTLEITLEANPTSVEADRFAALHEAGVLTLWDGACTPWPGVEIVPIDGHTRGQQIVRVAGSRGSAWYVADLMPTAAHVRIPYVMGYDIAAIETMPEKRAVLERAVADGSWVVLEHDPDVAMARPAAEGDDFTWAERVPADTGAATR